MKNLYKKIYEAINTGIQKALILDQDVSMNYNYKKIKNSPNLINQYVSELLNNEDDLKEIYKNLIQYHRASKYTYNISSFKELVIIYNKIRSIKNSNKKPNLEWVDTNGIVMIILKDGSEIPFNLFDKSMSNNAEFIKIIIPEESCQEIILHKNLMISDDKKIWCSNYEDYEWSNDKVDVKAFNGYQLTHKIQEILKQHPVENKKESAFSYIDTINKYIKNYNYEAYMPSIGELSFIYNHMDFINLLLSRLQSGTQSEEQYNMYSQLDIKSQYGVMSSTQSSIENEIFTINAQYYAKYNEYRKIRSVKPIIDRMNKNTYSLVLPLFKKI